MLFNNIFAELLGQDLTGQDPFISPLARVLQSVEQLEDIDRHETGRTSFLASILGRPGKVSSQTTGRVVRESTIGRDRDPGREPTPFMGRFGPRRFFGGHERFEKVFRKRDR